MRAIPTSEIFTRDDALALGWSDSALSRAVRGGRLIRLRRGFFATTTGAHVDALAVSAAVDGVVLSHRTALLMYGLPVVGQHPMLPELTVPPTGRGTVHAAYLHRAALPSEDVRSLPGGVQVTAVARTLVDVARSRPVTTAVAAMDAALHQGLVTPDEIDAVRIRCWNWPGIRRAHRAVALADGRAESPLESVSRLVMGWLRLPPPDLQRVVLDQRGTAIARLDYYWDEFGVAGEADGRAKYTDRDVLTAEKDRQELLENHRLVVARWGWTDAVHRPQRLRTRILDAHARGRALDRSGLPRLWSIQPQQAAIREEDPIYSAVRAGRPRASP